MPDSLAAGLTAGGELTPARLPWVFTPRRIEGMPTRLIREGIISSDRVNKLDWPAEVFYRRLLNKVDDHGLFDARPSVLLAALYPLQLSKVREANIVRWLADVEAANLVRRYAVEGKPYLQCLDTRWAVRSEPKYPLPEGATENNCKQLRPYSYSNSDTETGAQADAPNAKKARRKAWQTPTSPAH